jgi:hypothetical protein
MEAIKNVIADFQKKLISLGFDQEQITTILYEVVLIASAKLADADLSFLSKEELEFVSNKDLLQLTPEQLQDITTKTPNLTRYLDVYASKLREAIDEFDKIVNEVKQEEAEGRLPPLDPAIPETPPTMPPTMPPAAE